MTDCSHSSDHALDEPSRYVEWFEWAAAKGKTHTQVRCKGCGRFKVWIPRVKPSTPQADPKERTDD